MKYLFSLLFLFSYSNPIFAVSTTEILSPNGAIKLSVSLEKSFSYKIEYKGKALTSNSRIDFQLLDGRKLSSNLARPKVKTRSIKETITSPVPEKRKYIPDHFNEIDFRLANGFAITFRVYDDGVAYRISTFLKDSIKVESELAEFNFPDNPNVYYPQVVFRGNQDKYHTSFEEPYQIKSIDSIPGKSLIFTPILIAPRSGPKVVITEADIEDYPGMFLVANGNAGMKGEFAPYPKEEKTAEGLYSQVFVAERENYIAKTIGTRHFPWRVFMIAPEDKDLPANDLVYRLASPSRIADVSWISPRKSTEEWIISSNLFQVPFKSGVNTATYKYYIDFAQEFGFEQVLMDAGWSDNNDLFKITPEIDMDSITSYAKSKGIKIGIWTLAMTLDRQLEPALDQFNKWGVDFIMTDFMDRDDQKMVNFYHKVAQACGRHRIMLMFHGAFKPAGFNRTYPHALTREAVLGSEYNMWSAKATPDHNLLLPFIRMTSGPLDYEPGLLNNGTKEGFRANPEHVMSMGTRTQQLAMFLVYDSPAQFFSGNPSQGKLEPDFMKLMGSLPTTWDTTIVLDAKVGNYIVTARKKGNNWYIGGMNDLTSRNLKFDLTFLDDKKYKATICEDGLNADRNAMDYHLYSTTLTSKDTISVNMAAGGGYVIRLLLDD